MTPAPAHPAPRLPSVSVVVPVYNGERSVRALVERLAPVLAEAAGRFEVILVNDGSTDRSWPAIEELAALHRWVRGIDLERNYGQQNATLCGIRDARHEVVVTMDDDLEHPPESIPELLAPLDEGYDVVYGRNLPVGRGRTRTVGRRIIGAVGRWVVQVKQVHEASSFRALRTELRDAFSDYSESLVFLDLALTRGTRRFTSVPVARAPRYSGASNYRMGTLVAQALRMLVQASAAPLRVAAVVGAASALLGAASFTGGRGGRSGAPLLLASVAGELFSLPVLGLYAVQGRSRRLRRPSYRVRRRTGEAAIPADRA